MSQNPEGSADTIRTDLPPVPPLYVDRDDHTYLFMLLFAAHPELRIDYLAMAQTSFRMPDPRMWTALASIQRRLEPLRMFGERLRQLPSSRDYDPELDAPEVRRSMTQQQWVRAKERKAWQQLLSLPRCVTSAAIEAQLSPDNTTPESDGYSSSSVREGADEEDRNSSGSELRPDPDIAINGRAARDTEGWFAWRADKLAQFHEGNTMTQHNASESTEPELGFQGAVETASEANHRDNDNATQGSLTSLGMEEER